jgi:hypothetical protein
MIWLRIFKNSRSAGIAAIFFLSIILYLRSFLVGGALNGHEAMPFYNLIFGAIHTLPVVNRIITLAFMLVLGYMLIRTGVRYVLLENRSLMPGLFFILFSFALPESQQVTPALAGSIFYLFCFFILFDVHDKEPDTFFVFTAGLVLAMGSMFYLKLVWFIPLIWISLGTLRPVTWRELVYPVIAMALMFLFLFTWCWVVLDDIPAFSGLIRNNLSFNGSFDPLNYSVYIYYGFCLLLVLIASVYMINHFQSRKTLVQNIYLVMFYMFVAGILFFVFIARFDPGSLVYIAFPVAFILSDYFHRKRNPWIHELIMWVLMGLVVFMQLQS